MGGKRVTHYHLSGRIVCNGWEDGDDKTHHLSEVTCPYCKTWLKL